jgi:hypothetical protein
MHKRKTSKTKHTTQKLLDMCVLFCFSSSCVWWCPTAIVVCFVLFLFVLCMVVSNSYCGVFCFVSLRRVYGGVQQLLWCVLFCLSSSCVWWCPTAIVVCVLFCLSSSCVWWCPTPIVVYFVLFLFVLCMVVSNSYCGVFCFVCPPLVYGGVQQLLWCILFCFSSSCVCYTRRRQTKQNTPQ